VHYEWRKDEFPGKGFDDNVQMGVVAQEIELVYPELVKIQPDGYKSVDYIKLTPVLIEAIKEQQIQMMEQEIQIKEQQMQMIEQGIQIKELRNENKQLQTSNELLQQKLQLHEHRLTKLEMMLKSVIN